MSNSIVFYHDRNDDLHVIDPEALPDFDEHPPVLDIVRAVMNAGYQGVAVDEKQLANGMFILASSADQSTPEGQIVGALALEVANGKPLPSIEFVLEQIKNHYDELGRGHE
jgi:hypothetical protein